MNRQAWPNHLKARRKNSGLSQRDMRNLLGYRSAGQIARHERATSIPPLAIALGYEAVFKVPVSEIFVGLYGNIREELENKLRKMEAELHERSARDTDANLTARKLMWLNERRNS